MKGKHRMATPGLKDYDREPPLHPFLPRHFARSMTSTGLAMFGIPLPLRSEQSTSRRLH